MALIDSIITFIAGLLIGGTGIYLAALIITDIDNYSYAVETALIGAIVWGLASFFFGFIPVLGPLLVFVACFQLSNGAMRQTGSRQS